MRMMDWTLKIIWGLAGLSLVALSVFCMMAVPNFTQTNTPTTIMGEVSEVSLEFYNKGYEYNILSLYGYEIMAGNKQCRIEVCRILNTNDYFILDYSFDPPIIIPIGEIKD